MVYISELHYATVPDLDNPERCLEHVAAELIRRRDERSLAAGESPRKRQGREEAMPGFGHGSHLGSIECENSPCVFQL